MKIAVITTGFSRDENDTSGAAALHNFVKELSLSPGIDVTVFAMYYPFDKREYEYFKAKVFSFAKGNINNKSVKLRIWKKLRKKFSEEHIANKFDIIQSLWLGESGYIASQLSKKHNIPIAAACCGGELAGIKSINYGSQLKLWQRFFVRKTMKQANVIIAGSDFIINKLKQVYGGTFYHKAKKIPFGVDDKTFFPAEHKLNKEGRINLVNIANAVPVKAHDDLFKALSIVKEKFPDITLTCCGADEKNILAPLVKQYGLENNVILKGAVEHSEVPGILQSSDIFVLSSLHESQNVSIAEAAFCGLPVVSTKVGVAEEITPYLAEPGNYIQFALQIMNVISDYENAKINCKTLFQKNRERFTLKGSTEGFLKLYSGILT